METNLQTTRKERAKSFFFATNRNKIAKFSQMSSLRTRSASQPMNNLSKSLYIYVLNR
jgi:hypothetical protein